MVSSRSESRMKGASKNAPKRSQRPAVESTGVAAKNATSDAFCASVGPALLSAAEQAALSAGKALAQALQGLLTATNITKCLNCTGSKIEDGLDKIGHGHDNKNRQPNCGSTPETPSSPGSSSPGGSAPKKGVSRDKQGNPIPVKEPAYIDYPSKFDPSVDGPESRASTPSKTSIPVRTQWQSVKQTSVSERWRRASSQARPVLYAR